MSFELAVLTVQFAHPADPAIVVLGFLAHIGQNLFMRQNKERLFAYSPHTGVGNRFGLQHAIHGGYAIFAATGHFASDRLRAEDRNLDPVIAMGKRKPFRKAYRPCLVTP